MFLFSNRSAFYSRFELEERRSKGPPLHRYIDREQFYKAAMALRRWNTIAVADGMGFIQRARNRAERGSDDESAVKGAVAENKRSQPRAFGKEGSCENPSTSNG